MAGELAVSTSRAVGRPAEHNAGNVPIATLLLENNNFNRFNKQIQQPVLALLFVCHSPRP